MRKYVLIISIFLIVFASIYGWLAYRDYISYRNALPSNADLVVKVDVDQLIRRVIWHKITHPGELFSGEKREKQDRLRRDNGLSIPANVFLFTRNGDPETLYVSLPVSEKQKVIDFLQRRWDALPKDSTDSYWTGELSSNVKLIVNEERLLVSYSKNFRSGPLAEILNSLMKEGPEDDLLSSIKDADGDISAIFEEMQLDLALNDDALRLTVRLNEEADANEVPFLGALFSSNVNEDLSDGFKLASNARVTVQGLVQVTDTITSYDFNDDFEKVEVKEVVEKSVPGTAVQLKFPEGVDLDGEQVQALSESLSKAGLIHKKEEEGLLVFSNYESPLMTQDLKHLFELTADIPSLVGGFDELANLEFMNSLDSWTLKASKDNEVLLIESDLTFTEPAIEVLLSLQNKETVVENKESRDN